MLSRELNGQFDFESGSAVVGLLLSRLLWYFIVSGSQPVVTV